MDQETFSVRQGWRPREEPFDGVPDHLKAPLVDWLQRQFNPQSYVMNNELMLKVISAARLPVADVYQEERSAGNNRIYGKKLQGEIIQRCLEKSECFLDVIDALLRFSGDLSYSRRLRSLLEAGGSMYTVAKDGRSLQVRVSAASQLAARKAMSCGDAAAEEIEAAWSAAFGRNPDASDAWDHSIKAVEAALIPIVVPKQDKAQLGHVVGTLKSNEDRWRLLLAGDDQTYSISRLVSILELMWPNPDRHANELKRNPTLAESQCVVHLAVTVVQLSKTGILVK